MALLSTNELRKAQLLQLSILKELDKICRKNNISYFLSDGTLLGAIRHNGFIPWDDDLDVGMTRENYQYFCKIIETHLPENIFFQTAKNDKGYGLSFAKLRLKGTKWLEKGTEDCSFKTGIYIDIFPFDDVCHNILFQKIKCYLHNKIEYILYKKSYPHIHSSTIIKGVCVGCLYIIPKQVWLFILSLLEKKNKKSSKSSRYNFGRFFDIMVDKSVYEDLVLHKFEDGEFYIPRHYDLVLTKLFGDYMALPPIEKRKTHGIVAWDFGNY